MNICIDDIVVREIKEAEFPVLADLLYEAIFLDEKEGTDPLPKDIINDPGISIYIEAFGTEKGDHCYVADYKGWILGAVWTRILAGDIKGYGNVDVETPELSISMFKEYRNLGIGTLLVDCMLKCLKQNKYKRVSLSVNKANYAVEMYKKTGFKIIGEGENDFLMVLMLERP